MTYNWNPSWNSRCINHSLDETSPPSLDSLKATAESIEYQFFSQYRPSTDDFSVYTGNLGVVWTLYRMFKWTSDSRYLDHARELFNSTLENVRIRGHRTRDASLFTGRAGLYAIGAVLYSQDDEKRTLFVDKLRELSKIEFDANEVLYGRSGYLLACFLVEKELGVEFIDFRDVIEPVLDGIVAASGHERLPMWEWHESRYLGAAHGVCGILWVFIHCYPQYLDTHDDAKARFRLLLDDIVSQQFSSGNIPSSMMKQTDKLVHWCHGAPGWVYTLSEAAMYFDSSVYLDAALKCGECIWHRGLLRKGFGLCHGVSGNAYALLRLYQVFRDDRWKNRAVCFARASCQPIFMPWMHEAEKAGIHWADSPLSLYEGMCGWLFMLEDFLHDIEAAGMPCFDF